MTPKELRQQFEKETGLIRNVNSAIIVNEYVEWLESKLDTSKSEDWELLICDNCNQATSHLNGVCLECKPIQDRSYTSHTEKLTVDEVMARYGNLLSKDEIEQLESVAQKSEGTLTAEEYFKSHVTISTVNIYAAIKLAKGYALMIGEAVKQMCADKTDKRESVSGEHRESIMSVNVQELIK